MFIYIYIYIYIYTYNVYIYIYTYKCFFINSWSFMPLLDNHQLKIVTSVQVTI